MQLYDDYPSRYSADVSRRHRWIRGDWQIAGWLLRRVPGARRTRAAQSAVAAVAMEDLRQPAAQSRPAGAAAAAAAGLDGRSRPPWCVDAGGARRPRRCPSLIALAARARAASRRRAAAAASRVHRRAPRRGARPSSRSRSRAFPTKRAFSADAIVRTHWRMLVTRRRLLEWTPSSEQDRRDRDDARARRSRRCGSRRRSPLATGAYLAHDASRGAAGGRSRSCCSGSSRRRSRGGSAVRCAPRAAKLTRRADRSSCASSRAGPGRFSRRSSGRTITGCRPTTIQEVPVGDGRASHVADQHGHGAARQPRRVRFRLPAGRAAGRAH